MVKCRSTPDRTVAEGVLLGQWLTRAYLEARTLGGRRGYDLAVFGAVNSWVRDTR